LGKLLAILALAIILFYSYILEYSIKPKGIDVLDRLKIHLITSIICVAAITISAAEWTVMVYIGGDNNLTEYINGDIDEMESAGSTADVNIICQVDGLVGGWDEYGYDDYLGDEWETVRRYRIESGSAFNNQIDAGFIADLGELNSEDPDVLRDFVIWAVDNYPANRYMLVLWNHGGGWERKRLEQSIYKAIIWDDTDGDGEGITFSDGEYANALSDIRDHIGRSLSIVGFDACVVGLLESEYETMGYADYLVHSEANIPGEGWDYGFLQDLIADPYASEEEIIEWIVDKYADYYGWDITLSGIRLDHDHVDFQITINDFARELILAGGKSNSAITGAIIAAQDFGNYLSDIYDFANEIDSRNIGGASSDLDLTAKAVKNALGYPPPVVGKPLVDNYQEGYPGAHGVMIYNPLGSALSQWSNLGISECNLWWRFIDGETSLPPVLLAYWGNTMGKYIGTGTPTNLYIRARNMGSGTASSVTATLSSCDTRVSITGGPVSFGDITAGVIATSTTPFQITVSPSAADSAFIPFEITFSTGKTTKFILTAVGELNYPPSITTLDAPFDDARVITGSPTLTWDVPDDPDSDPLHFDIQWDTSAGFSNPITISSDINSIGFSPSVPRASGTGTCSYTVNSQSEGAMANGSTYYWRARAKDDHHTGQWSDERVITINTSLSEFDWHQTTNYQFLNDNVLDLTINNNEVFLPDTSIIIDDDMEYSSEEEAWAVWNTYEWGTFTEVTLENRRQVSGVYSLRTRDRDDYDYVGAWRIFDPIKTGTISTWAKIYSPALGDKSEFIGLHYGLDYSDYFTEGVIVYVKAETLKYWDGDGHIIHTHMDSLWHHYKIDFDLEKDSTALYVDDLYEGSFSGYGLSWITMLACGTKLLGNDVRGTAYMDDFLLTSTNNTDSGVIVGRPVAFDWRPDGKESWGHACWTQNSGDSIKVTVQRKIGSWIDYISASTIGTNGIIDITGLGTADSVRLIAVLYRSPDNRAGGSPPVLYDWTVNWDTTSLHIYEEVKRPEHLVIYPNRPNPFNAVTDISYETFEDGAVVITVFNILGETVFRHKSNQPAGRHHLRFDASDLPSGAYYCRISSSSYTAERKMVLLK